VAAICRSSAVGRPGGGVTAHDFGRPGFPMQEVADVAEPTSIHREPSA